MYDCVYLCAICQTRIKKKNEEKPSKVKFQYFAEFLGLKIARLGLVI